MDCPAVATSRRATNTALPYWCHEGCCFDLILYDLVVSWQANGQIEDKELVSNYGTMVIEAQMLLGCSVDRDQYEGISEGTI